MVGPKAHAQAICDVPIISSQHRRHQTQQLSHVVDFTVSEFAEKRALPASMFSAFTDMAKQALPDAGDGSEDRKDIPQSQVSKVLKIVVQKQLNYLFRVGLLVGGLVGWSQSPCTSNLRCFHH